MNKDIPLEVRPPTLIAEIQQCKENVRKLTVITKEEESKTISKFLMDESGNNIEELTTNSTNRAAVSVKKLLQLVVSRGNRNLEQVKYVSPFPL